MKQNRTYLAFFVLFSLLFLTGCKSGNGVVTPTPIGSDLVATASPVATDTPMPTETPQPNRILLYSPAENSSSDVADIQVFLSEKAAQAGMLLDVRTQISAADIIPDIMLVVLMGESGIDLAGMAQQHPAIPFVVFRQSAQEGLPSNVISIISDDNYLNFAAGYLSMLIAPDWRLGALLPWDDGVSGAETLEAFTNGAAYHCGRCASTYMPVTLFPVVEPLPSNSTPDSWQAAILTLDNQYYLYTVYVAPEAASDALYQQLVTQNVTVVGAKRPENIEGLLWAASINQNPAAALQVNWDAILSGTLTENVIIVPIEVSEVNEEYFTPGRQRMFAEMLENLMGGWVLPLSPDYP